MKTALKDKVSPEIPATVDYGSSELVEMSDREMRNLSSAYLDPKIEPIFERQQT